MMEQFIDKVTLSHGLAPRWQDHSCQFLEAALARASPKEAPHVHLLLLGLAGTASDAIIFAINEAYCYQYSY